MGEEKQPIEIRIRDLRRARSLTQEELAEALGLSRQSINAMEAGRALPSLPVALQIAAYFSVPVTSIFLIERAEQSLQSHQHNQSQEEPMSHLVPWSPLREMREMLDEMMDSSATWAPAAITIPAANISQTADEVHVEMRLPGYQKEDLSIEVGEDFVTIAGENKAEQSEDEKHYVRREFAQQSFSRTMALPALVQTENASAEMKHGVLKVTLKKVIEEKPKTAKIDIKSE